MTIDNKSRLAQRIAIATLAALIALFIAWFGFLIPPTHQLTILLIHVVPLLLFVPGMLKGKPNTFIWLCFVILLYFCQGSMNAFALPHRLGVLGLIEALLTAVLFCSSMLAGRYLKQADFQ